MVDQEERERENDALNGEVRRKMALWDSALSGDSEALIALSCEIDLDDEEDAI